MQVTVNGFKVEVPEGASALEAAEAAGFTIPQPCNKASQLEHSGQCGICLIEVDGRPAQACKTRVKEGSALELHTPTNLTTRAHVAESIWSNHFEEKGNDCSTCGRTGKPTGSACTFYSTFGPLRAKPVPGGVRRTPSMIELDPRPCWACNACADACGVGAITLAHRAGRPMLDLAACISCGQCWKVCPTGALHLVDRMNELLGLVTDTSLSRWYQYAPGILPGIMVKYGLRPEDASHELMYAILARMNAYRVMSTLVGADIITVEEGNEGLDRISSGKLLPILTTCCPGHEEFIEKEAARLLKKYGVDIMPYRSSAHSPQEAVGGLMRHMQETEAERKGKRHVNISIMPCTAKQGEANRFGNRNVDVVITTVEFFRLIEYLGIDVHGLVAMQRRGALPPLSHYPMAVPNSGGAALFAQSGGVTLAVLRYIAHKLLGRPLAPHEERRISRTALDGDLHVTLIEVTLADLTVRALVARGPTAARRAYEMVASGAAQRLGIHLIEVMACPDGCITGGGQEPDKELDCVRKRAALAAQDRASPECDPADFAPVVALMRTLGPRKCHELFHRPSH